MTTDTSTHPSSARRRPDPRSRRCAGACVSGFEPGAPRAIHLPEQSGSAPHERAGERDLDPRPPPVERGEVRRRELVIAALDRHAGFSGEQIDLKTLDLAV